MNTEAAKKSTGEHRVTMQSRNSMEVYGVTDVTAFDEQSVMLETSCGALTVEGDGLHIHVLDLESGIVTMNGRVDCLIYETADQNSKKQSGGFFGKLFR